MPVTLSLAWLPPGPDLNLNRDVNRDLNRDVNINRDPYPYRDETFICPLPLPLFEQRNLMSEPLKPQFSLKETLRQFSKIVWIVEIRALDLTLALL